MTTRVSTRAQTESTQTDDLWPFSSGETAIASLFIAFYVGFVLGGWVVATAWAGGVQ